MNILPKKRWHVRTKDNITRVRRDEAEAHEKEKQRLEKLKFAESEARINFLRHQSGLPERSGEEPKSTKTTESNKTEHFDLFADYKSHVKTTNQDLEKEEKTEREKYEKQIGYLTYLGQDTNEALKVRSWYELAPKRLKPTKQTNVDLEKDMKSKFTHDPLTLINALLPSELLDKKLKSSNKGATTTSNDNISGNKEISLKTTDQKKSEKPKKSKQVKKSKKEKKSKKNKKDDKKHKRKTSKCDIKPEQEKHQRKLEILDRLRKERLKREATERVRQEELLCPNLDVKEEKKPQPPRIVQKYNSQFNPDLAKQNLL